MDAFNKNREIVSTLREAADIKLLYDVNMIVLSLFAQVASL